VILPSVGRRRVFPGDDGRGFEHRSSPALPLLKRLSVERQNRLDEGLDILIDERGLHHPHYPTLAAVRGGNLAPKKRVYNRNLPTT